MQLKTLWYTDYHIQSTDVLSGTGFSCIFTVIIKLTQWHSSLCTRSLCYGVQMPPALKI